MLNFDLLLEEGHAAVLVEARIFVQQFEHETSGGQDGVITSVMGVHMRDGRLKSLKVSGRVVRGF